MIGRTAALLYPEFDTNPDSFWSFSNSMKDLPPNQYGGKKMNMMPLGLLGLGNHLLMGKHFDKAVLVDRNIYTGDLEKALSGIDIVFVSAMLAQKKGLVKAALEVKKLGKTLVVGGPILDDRLMGELPIDYGIVNEAELVIDGLLSGLASGNKKGLFVGAFSPPELFFQPDYSLIDPRDYVNASMQTNRGCPWNCEFCDITSRFGKKVREVPYKHIERALCSLNRIGYHGALLICDDNHTGDKLKAIEKQKFMYYVEKKIGYKLPKFAQVSMDLADDNAEMAELRKWMYRNGFYQIFVGVETSNLASLKETGKQQNMRGGKTLEQKLSLLSREVAPVAAGAIYGFDNDTTTTLEDFADLINRTGSPTWMAGLLVPFSGTRLETRLKNEGRLMKGNGGNNSDSTMSYIPMNISAKKAEEDIIWFWERIYNPGAYFRRVMRDVATAHPVKFHALLSFKDSCNSVRSVLMGKYGNEYRKRLPEAIFNIVKNGVLNLNMNLLWAFRTYMTHCSEYTHYRTILDQQKENIGKKHYEKWQLQSWKELEAKSPSQYL